MQIKLVDGTIYNINDMKIENGTLYIEFSDKSAEEVQTILAQPTNLGKIILLEDSRSTDLAYYEHFTISAGVLLSPDSKVTGMLNQEREDTTVRLENVETKAGEALALAQSLNSKTTEIKADVESVQTDVQSVKTDVQDAKTLSQENAKSTMLSFAASQIIAQSFEDADAISVKDLYPKYSDCIGKKVKQGFKMNHEDVLYKTLQPELTISELYVPGSVGTESLYTVIDEVHQGTQEDPIPYFGNMELEQDKYYTQDNVMYHCTRGTGQPVYYALADLVGLYVEVVKEA